MTTAIKTIYDVFLSHAAEDIGVAELVQESLRDTGLGVYSVESVQTGKKVLDEMRRELAESNAVILLLTKSSLRSPNLAFVSGLAMAWNKPIFVLFDGIRPEEIPEYLKQFQTFRVSESDHVANVIADSAKPLDESARAALLSVYSELGVPTDQLLMKPMALHELHERYSKLGQGMASPERLLQELLRLRKQGRLPRVRKKTG